LIIGVAILFYASYSDMKIRRVSNKTWLIMGALGLILLGFTEWDFMILASFGIMFLIALIIALFNIFGGADVKALAAIALLTPLWPHLEQFPLYPSMLLFPLTIFVNSLILFLVFPVYFSLYNICKQDVEFPQCILGYRINAKQAKDKFVWPMERIENGKRKKEIFPIKNQNLDDLGDTLIWVTPKIPFMVPLLMGFIVSFLVGDILYLLIDVLI
jgi:preflagellin peptidase FlaK